LKRKKKEDRKERERKDTLIVEERLTSPFVSHGKRGRGRENVRIRIERAGAVQNQSGICSDNSISATDDGLKRRRLRERERVRKGRSQA
jgi:hypothetical protein